MTELSPVKARLMAHEAKEYAKSLAQKSTAAFVKSMKEQTGLGHMAFVDLGGGLVGWISDVGLRYATQAVGKKGATGLRGWVDTHGAMVSGTASGLIGTAAYVGNALTNKVAPLKWYREMARAASGTLSIFGLDRTLTAALRLPTFPTPPPAPKPAAASPALNPAPAPSTTP